MVSASITAMPRPFPTGMFDPMPKVRVVLDDGQELDLFEYFPDELSFTPDEFIGLTVAEARALRHQKDVAYLRS